MIVCNRWLAVAGGTWREREPEGGRVTEGERGWGTGKRLQFIHGAARDVGRRDRGRTEVKGHSRCEGGHGEVIEDGGRGKG
jgi:hypothetical protein